MSKPFKFIKDLIDNAILEDNKKKYYVGKIIMDTANVNPATYLRFGTWQYWGSGRVPVGVDTTDSDFNTVEKTGGEKKHTMTINEMPEHDHSVDGYTGSADGAYFIATCNGTGTKYEDASFVSQKGGGQPFNIQQQYITCYMWKRTV